MGTVDSCDAMQQVGERRTWTGAARAPRSMDSLRAEYSALEEFIVKIAKIGR